MVLRYARWTIRTLDERLGPAILKAQPFCRLLFIQRVIVVELNGAVVSVFPPDGPHSISRRVGQDNVVDDRRLARALAVAAAHFGDEKLSSRSHEVPISWSAPRSAWSAPKG